MTALSLHDVVVTAGSRRILDGISFEVLAHQTLAVAGWPGFGGTTLARVVVGAVKPTAGTVRVAGEDVTTTPSDRRRVGYLPADGGLLPQLTVEENIGYGMRIRGAGAERTRTLARQAAERCELVAALGLRPHQLSAGQRLQTALARVSLRRLRPQVLVVDATAGSTVRGVADLVSRLGDPTPPAVVVAVCTGNTQVVGEADHLVVVAGGQATTSGAVSQLRRDPPDLLTAVLVFPAPLPVHAGVVEEAAINCGPVLLPRPAWLPVGLRVKVALPPDALSRRSPDKPTTTCVAVAARPEGARVHVLAQPEGLPDVRWPLRFSSGDRPRLGQRLRVGVVANRLLVFDDDAAARRVSEGGRS